MKWKIDLNDINEFSIEENQILHAYYIINAIERLEKLKSISQSRIDNLKHEYYWAYTWKKTINITDMFAIIGHLKKVCEHHQKTYGYPYHQDWLLNFDDTFYDRIVKRHFPYLAKREAIETVKASINEI
jgi:hypothetical protein